MGYGATRLLRLPLTAFSATPWFVSGAGHCCFLSPWCIDGDTMATLWWCRESYSRLGECNVCGAWEKAKPFSRSLGSWMWKCGTWTWFRSQLTERDTFICGMRKKKSCFPSVAVEILYWTNGSSAGSGSRSGSSYRCQPHWRDCERSRQLAGVKVTASRWFLISLWR
jgi:hypothetical protein